MNGKLVTGHGRTGLTQVTTVLGHARWAKERDDENVRPRAQFYWEGVQH